MSHLAFWIVAEVESAQFNSLTVPIAIDAFPDEQRARDHAEAEARANPGKDYGLFIMIETVKCDPQATPVVWEECDGCK